MSEIKCVLFDIGSVLVDWHMSWITLDVSKRFKIPEDLVIHAFSKYLPHLDSGNIDERVFWRNIANEVDSKSLRNNDESLWDTYFRKNVKLNHDVIALAKTIGNNSYTMGILSNIEKVTHKVVDDWNVLDGFEYKFMSYQIGFSKPDPRIYQHVIENVSLDPNQLLFIDDKTSNVSAAKNSGINAIHFTGISELKNSLASFGNKAIKSSNAFVSIKIGSFRVLLRYGN